MHTYIYTHTREVIYHSTITEVIAHLTLSLIKNVKYFCLYGLQIFINGLNQ